MKKLLIVLITGAVVFLVTDAVAQMPDRPRVTGGTATPSYPEAEARTEPRGDDWRNGWVLGIGPVGGVPINNDCDGCEQSPMTLGMAMQVGRMLTPRLALMLDTHAVAVGQADVEVAGISTTSVVQGVAAIALQYWPSERLWLKGGIGHGEAQGTVAVLDAFGGSVDLKAEETGFGMLLAAGYEIYQGGLFALDLHVRYAGMHLEPKYRGNLALGLGFAWYP